MFIGLLDTDVQMTDFYSVQMTIISGPQRGKIKIVALGGFGVCVYSHPWETSLHVFVDGALWTISSADNHGSHH